MKKVEELVAASDVGSQNDQRINAEVYNISEHNSPIFASSHSLSIKVSNLHQWRDCGQRASMV